MTEWSWTSWILLCPWRCHIPGMLGWALWKDQPPVTGREVLFSDLIASMWFLSKDLPNSFGAAPAKTSSSSINVASSWFRWVAAFHHRSTDMLVDVFPFSSMACCADSVAPLVVSMPFLADSSRLIRGMVHQVWGSVVWPCCDLHFWQSLAILKG